MDRFTHMSDGYYAVSRDVCYEDQNEEMCGEAIDRLAAYEDTCLGPDEVSFAIDINDCMGDFQISRDRLRELAAADKEGKCIVLPCTCSSCKNGKLDKELSSPEHGWLYACSINKNMWRPGHGYCDFAEPCEGSSHGTR